MIKLALGWWGVKGYCGAKWGVGLLFKVLNKSATGQFTKR
jgi:hypothetical protein